MKVLFAGPSLGQGQPDLNGIELRAPASQGDVLRAVMDGATAIGLVDGLFEAVASVWHKELLYALSEGVRVYGAASMGALRAAECAAFGMVPIGVIAAAYCRGDIDDDAAVAQLHAPAQLGHRALTEALVESLFHVERLAKEGMLSGAEAVHLATSASALHFKDRTADAVIANSAVKDAGRRAEVLRLYRENWLSQKTLDALALIDVLRACPETRSLPPNWTLNTPRSWLRALEAARVESER